MAEGQSTKEDLLQDEGADHARPSWSYKKKLVFILTSLGRRVGVLEEVG